MKEYIKNRKKTDADLRLIRNTRRKIHHALIGKSKSSSTRKILGIDIETYKKWKKFQMTSEMNWNNMEINQVQPMCMFDVSKEELKEAFCWKNTQRLLEHDHQKKSFTFIFLDYQLQFIKAYQFIKLNDKRPNEEFHRWDI